MGPDYVTFSKDDFLESAVNGKVAVSKDGMFRLSPIPASQPIPALSSLRDFRPLTDDMDDREEEHDVGYKKNSMDPYMIRSIDPIPIKPSIYRMPSNSSLLDRPEMDIISRSMPRSSLDVHMASCSSSPNVSNLHRHTSMKAAYPWAERERPRRTSAESQGENRDNEEQRNRWLAQLHDLLDSPKPACVHGSRRNIPVEPEVSKHDIDDDSLSKPGSLAIPRNPSPVSPASSSLVSATSMHPPPLPGAPTPICRASTAAAERERLLAASKIPPSTIHATSPTSVSHATAVRDRDRTEAHHPTPSQAPYSQSRPTQSRRQSTDGAKGKLAASTASNLTRSLWAMQETQATQRIS